MFVETMIDSARKHGRSRRPATFTIAVVAQVVIIGSIAVTPLLSNTNLPTVGAISAF
ncbi:MAG: hypothetical protein HYX75_23510 [Acidobacteria bacterium]|nr:hypothetical protein [Acidobacteriota bacterium]